MYLFIYLQIRLSLNTFCKGIIAFMASGIWRVENYEFCEGDLLKFRMIVRQFKKWNNHSVMLSRNLTKQSFRL